jgi:hypothetical protein
MLSVSNLQRNAEGGACRGATHSNIILMDITGKIIATATGPGTNHHMTGMAECQKRIADMVNSARLKAKMGFHQPLDALVSFASLFVWRQVIDETVSGYQKSRDFSIELGSKSVAKDRLPEIPCLLIESIKGDNEQRCLIEF